MRKRVSSLFYSFIFLFQTLFEAIFRLENYFTETSLRAGSFSGTQWRRETLRRRQIYVGYSYQNSRIKKHVKTQDEFSVFELPKMLSSLSKTLKKLMKQYLHSSNFNTDILPYEFVCDDAFISNFQEQLFFISVIKIGNLF